jgi:hypothetical protein
MKKYFLLPLIVAILALAAFFVWGIPYFFQTPLPDAAGSPMGTGTVKAEVSLILEEGTIDLGGTVQTYQLLRVTLLEGEYAGIPMEVDYGKRQVHPEGIRFDFEFIAEEIVRTLVGSLGLIAAVPITTAIAAALALYSHRLGWRALLGPETLSSSGGGHVH